MAFQKVASLEADNTISLGKKDKATGKAFPTQAEGYYLGNRTVSTKLGPSTLHILQTAKGNLGVWGGTDMNRKLNQVQAGTMVRITAAGKKPTPKGDMNVFNVEVDNDNQIEVLLSGLGNAGTGTTASDFAANDDGDTGYTGAYGDTETSFGVDDNEEDKDEGYEAPPAKVASGLSAADRQAKVQALLKGNTAKKRA